VNQAKDSSDQNVLSALLPHHPAEVLANKHFQNWTYVRDLLK
jgi:hypothetical protein